MPSWKKVIISGSAAELSSVFAPSITGSLQGTASIARTASFVTGSNVFGPFGSNSVISASFASTASSSSFAGTAISASYAATSSFSLATSANQLLVINKSGATIAKGVVVHLTGSTNSSDTPYITTASYESDNLSANSLGITAESIAFNNTGYVTTEGVLTGLNVTGFIAGQVVYLGSNGAIIGSAPIAPLHSVRLGQVVRDSPSNNGSIYVRIDNGYEIGELHDVIDSTTTASFGDLLVKSGSVWTTGKQLTGSYGLTGSLTVTGSTATDLVRITQTGTGNAFKVEDSTNPDNTPFIIDNVGDVMIGTTSSKGAVTIASNGADGLVLDTDTASNTQSSRLFFKNSGSFTDFSIRNTGQLLVIAASASAGVSSGTGRMFISASGEVAIGTGYNVSAGRGAALQVSGSINIEEGFAYKQDGYDILYITRGAAGTSYDSIIGGVGALSGALSPDQTTAYGYYALANSNGTANTAIGYNAGDNNTGSNQTLVGWNAGSDANGGSQTAMGRNAGYGNNGTFQAAYGFQAGYQNVGTNQTAIGPNAGYQNTASNQTAIGESAGYRNSGSNQTAVGANAGDRNTATQQSALGLQAGYFNTGVAQTALGQQAGQSNIGTNQTATGYVAGYQNSGSFQTATGANAGRDNKGDLQTATGYESGRLNTADNQSAHGYRAGYGNSGSNQTAIGLLAGRFNSGSNQTAVGVSAGEQNSGNTQTAIGAYAGYANTGSAQTVTGYQAGYQNIADYQTATGYQAGYQNTGSYQTAYGYRSGYFTTASTQTAIGGFAGRAGISSAQTAVGFSAGEFHTGSNQTAIGAYAGRFVTASNQTAVGYAAGEYNIGASQTATGYQAGTYNSGSAQTATGFQAGVRNLGTNQTVTGYQAGYENSGSNQSAYGYQAGFENSGSNQVAMGNSAGEGNKGNNQTALGSQAGYLNTGSNQTAVGYAAGFRNSGSDNTNIGYQAGTYTTGVIINSQSAQSVFLGSQTTAGGGNRTNQIVIGYGTSGIGSNSVVLGNSSITTTALRGDVGINTTTPTYTLQIHAAPTASIRLQETGSGGNKRLDLTIDASGVARISANQSAQQMAFDTVNVERIRITEFGNVGINKTTPNATLDVSGSTIISGSLTTTSSVAFKAYTSPTSFPGIAAGYLAFDSAGNIITTGGVTAGAAGNNTEIQYNNAGALAGTSAITFDGTTLRATGSFTGSLIGALTGTASFAVSASRAITASFAVSASRAITASFAVSASRAITASFALTSSFITGSNVYGPYGANSVISASYTATASYFNATIQTSGSSIYSTNPSTTGFSLVSGIYIGSSAGEQATDANNSNFIGKQAGKSATNARNSNFIGLEAGLNASASINSNFIGVSAGTGAHRAAGSVFIGDGPGVDATDAQGSIFIGGYTGATATYASASVFIGDTVGYNNKHASNCIFIGAHAGYSLDASEIYGVSSNNIIIGNDITLASGSKDSINIGGIIFGTGTYIAPDTSFGTPTTMLSGSVPNGRIGICTTTPNATFDVNGSTIITGSLTVGDGTNTNLDPYGFVFGSGSYLSGSNSNSAILGGIFNKIHTDANQGIGNVILGGNRNMITGSNGFSALGHQYSAIIGGELNSIDSNYPGSGEMIAASYSSSIRDSFSSAIIASKASNIFYNFQTPESVAIIAAERSEIASTQNAAIIGGYENKLEKLTYNSVILGGTRNLITGSVQNSAVIGGSDITGSKSDTVYMPNAHVTGSFESPAGNTIDSNALIQAGLLYLSNNL